jgi:hypothetical protein
VYKWLDNALDIGISEETFWMSTLIENRRMFESYNRRTQDRLKERAVFDYALADLIGKSVARIYNSNNKMPEICEQYPQLFDSVVIQEQKQERADELTALRFKLFAESFNKRFNDKEAANIE